MSSLTKHYYTSMTHKLEKNDTLFFYILVPTVIHSHINNQENSKLQTTYNKHFGSEHTDISSVLKSTSPQTFQQICKKLSDKGEKE